MDEESVQYIYSFEYDDQDKKAVSFTLNFTPDRTELLEIEPKVEEVPSWVLLHHYKCENCTLTEEDTRYCPVALNVVQIIKHFKDTSSLEPVEVKVITPERESLSRTHVQYALGSLLGLCNAVSGCPVMKEFAPLARFHLPFASLDETIYRIVGNYLIGQYFRKKKGEEPDWELDGLKKYYKEVEKVNRALCNRLRAASVKDANMNAVITLDNYVKSIVHLLDKKLEKICQLYTRTENI